MDIFPKALAADVVAELKAKAIAGDLAACDALGTHFYALNDYEESAALYLKALRGGFYKQSPSYDSERHFFRMVRENLISPASDAATFVREREKISADFTARADRACGMAGISVFIGYMLLIYVGGIHGMLREYSLLIAGGLSWGAWTLVRSGFDSDA